MKNIYEVSFKNRVFFCNVIVGYKMKIKGVIEDFKKLRKNFKMILVKIYLGIFLELLWAMWGQFNFTEFLVPVIVLKIYRPLPM